jgi:NAD(P)-dependent dehydrogenase (short-subunit alcohol dehydrogenase family)
MTGENESVEDLTAADTAPEPARAPRGPANRVAVVTGASSGIGRAAATELCRRGWTVALVGRDEARLAGAVEAARAAPVGPGGPAGSAEGYRCDFGRLDDVRALAGRLRAAYPRIDLLANNAGGAFGQRRSTVDGLDQTMQINHLAPFLLSHELRDALRGGRIVNTASGAHTTGTLDPDDFDSAGQRFRSLAVYATAKQANVLFASEAARRWPDILSTSYHPGIVRSRFGNESAVIAFFFRFAPFIRTPEKGAETLVWLATTDASAITPGGYYMDRKLRSPSDRASDPDLAARLWEASLRAVGLARPAEPL